MLLARYLSKSVHQPESPPGRGVFSGCRRGVALLHIVGLDRTPGLFRRSTTAWRRSLRRYAPGIDDLPHCRDAGERVAHLLDRALVPRRLPFGAGVANHIDVEPALRGVTRRGLDADRGGHARYDQLADAQPLQGGVERGRVKGAVGKLVQDKFALRRAQFVGDGRIPVSGLHQAGPFAPGVVETDRRDIGGEAHLGGVQHRHLATSRGFDETRAGRDDALADQRVRRIEMKQEPLELIRGSGNVFRDLGYPDADIPQMKALLAAEILKTLGRERLTVRQAQERTGIAAADFSRIRQCDLKRFTLDRLMGIVNKLGSRIEMTLKFKPDAKYAAAARATTLLAAEPKAGKYASKKTKG